MLLWVGPWMLVAYWLALELGQPRAAWYGGITVVAGGVFLLTVIVRLWIHGTRRRSWKKHYRGQLLELLQRFSRGLRQPTNAPDQPVA